MSIFENLIHRATGMRNADEEFSETWPPVRWRPLPPPPAIDAAQGESHD